MNRRGTGAAWLAALLVVLLAPPARAGLGDKLKGKLKQKVEQKTDQAVDGAASGDAAGDAAEPGTAGAESAAAPAGSSEKVNEVSTKFDYVPGDKVLLYDDFMQDELGEFPARQWKLVGGTFEVVEQAGEHWLRCVSVDGRIRMKLPAAEKLPEFWTLEFDFYATEPMGSAITVEALGPRDDVIWETVFPQGNALAFRTGDIFSTTAFEGTVPGRHHLMVMARQTGIKVYLDRQRMASVPEVWTQPGVAKDLEIRLWASTHPMITNVRYAEGCRPPKDMLAEGKLVTYGIRFASGSDVVLPDSAPVLRQVAAYMEANGAVKLAITGHTDNEGSAASNLDLSKRRAAAVAKVLSEQFKIAADRFTTDGKGDTEKVADNATAAGRAMNRRVEFMKL